MQKSTAPGIPRRSPIQVLNEPKLAKFGDGTRTSALNVVWLEALSDLPGDHLFGAIVNNVATKQQS